MHCPAANRKTPSRAAKLLLPVVLLLAGTLAFSGPAQAEAPRRASGKPQVIVLKLDDVVGSTQPRGCGSWITSRTAA